MADASQLHAPAPEAASRARDYRLDFFRGLALIFIFIDHIPDNAFRRLTLQSFAFSDAAEVFIFISGYTAAMVYGRVLLREGGLMASARVLRRVWQLYVAHLCLFMIYNAEVSYTLLHFDNPLFSDELRVGAFLAEPERTFLAVLLLRFQPSLLNILPLYILLLLVFPAVLLALRRHWALALVPSALLWLAVQVWEINLMLEPGDQEWYFDPFAWQFLFVLAASFGYARARGRNVVPRWPWLLPAAVTFIAVCAVVQGARTLHEINPRIPALLTVPVWADEKTHLPPLRVLSMLALSYAVSRLVSPGARFMTSRLGWPVVLCGQHSLYVFCLTILLSVLAVIALSLAGGSLIVQFGVNMAGVGIMVAFALLLAWYGAGGRLPPRPQPPPLSAQGA